MNNIMNLLLSAPFVSSDGRNGTFVNGTSLAPSSNSTTSGCLSQYINNGGYFASTLIIGILALSAVFL